MDITKDDIIYVSGPFNDTVDCDPSAGVFNVYQSTGSFYHAAYDTSIILGLIENSMVNNLNIYPVPAHNTLHFNTAFNNNSLLTVGIKNITGQLVLSHIYKNESEIIQDVSMLNPGMYFIQVQNDNKFYFGKFVKE